MCNSATNTGLQLAGTLLSAKGAVSAGDAQSAEMQYRAAQERSAAKQVVAEGSTQVANTDLAGQMIESRMRALAGASGVSMASPTIVNLVSKAAGVTELNKEMELFNAQSTAATIGTQASADEYSASQARRTSRTRAFGTILSGMASIYGANKPGGPAIPDVGGTK